MAFPSLKKVEEELSMKEYRSDYLLFPVARLTTIGLTGTLRDKTLTRIYSYNLIKGLYGTYSMFGTDKERRQIAGHLRVTM